VTKNCTETDRDNFLVCHLGDAEWTAMDGMLKPLMRKQADRVATELPDWGGFTLICIT